MSPNVVTLDVREDLRAGREPFARIMSAVAGLQADDQLQLVAPFEPVPLFHVLAKQGFTHTSRALASGDWEVLFTHLSDAPTGATVPAPATKGSQDEAVSMRDDVWEVDARGLEPPQPMVKILETLAAMPANAVLCARTDRRPMHLYPQLEQRGFSAETEEQPDGSFLTQIRRG